MHKKNHPKSKGKKIRICMNCPWGFSDPFWMNLLVLPWFTLTLVQWERGQMCREIEEHPQWAIEHLNIGRNRTPDGLAGSGH